MSLIAHMAFEGFEIELLNELGARVKSHDKRLVLTEGREDEDPIWAQNTWLAPEEISVASINEAARALRTRGRFWTCESQQLHRRSQLIQEKLPKVREARMEFLEALPERTIGSWALLGPDRALVSAKCRSAFPGGRIAFTETKSAPSRAYLKLWELFTARGVQPPRPGETCVDLGASPGGWTWVLGRLGVRVIAVDRAPLAPEAMKLPGVEFKKGDAFSFQPSEPIDWLFSDLICYPEDILELVQRWRHQRLARNIVCSVKFKGETDHATVNELLRIPGSRAKHLVHNKHELTWWCVQPESSAHRA